MCGVRNYFYLQCEAIWAMLFGKVGFFVCFRFILKCERVTERERKEEEEREKPSHLLIHFPNCCKIQVWARGQPGVSFGCPEGLGHLSLLSQILSKELDW